MYFTTKSEEALRELLHQEPDRHPSKFSVFERRALMEMLDDPYIPDVIRKAMRACAYPTLSSLLSSGKAVSASELPVSRWVEKVVSTSESPQSPQEQPPA